MFWICIYFFKRYFGFVYRFINFVPKGSTIIIIIIFFLKN
jgi:hypothetical protein